MIHKQNTVFVLSNTKAPLMSCTPGRARQLLTKGRAAVFRRYPFTIILKDRSEGVTQNIDLKIDPGSRTTGFALVSTCLHIPRKCIWGMELTHRGVRMSMDITTRRMYRRARRSRLRYRPARFSNRLNMKGRLPPSVQHRVETTDTWQRRLVRLVPVTRIVHEYVSFDVQRLRNPDIKGREYQRGRLFRTELREYLLEAYNRTCQYCAGATLKAGIPDAKYLERDHQIPRSKGGSDALYNAVLACLPCNRAKGSMYLEQWFKSLQGKSDPVSKARLRQIPKVMTGLKPSFRDAAVMNGARDRIWYRALDIGFEVIRSPGWFTKYHRLVAEYPKAHWIDAAVVHRTSVLDPGMCVLRVTATGHGTRRMVLPDRYGSPRRNRHGTLSVKGPSTVHGFQTGDTVRYLNRDYRVTIRSSGWFTLRGPGPHVRAGYNHLHKVYHKDGYKYN